ncbi:transketolase [Clostridium felsineum]|uniref:Apulose-4-phosphate transketolase subunit A n=1 Tax=Clostridium felsineum TaxID=36839 RepID=A0A1S8L5J3_9CLOT|nr:transketolase [Clostridium felsineum]URZ00739.1 Apulose-4-phosphate transketolase subunit A [Clostridium felsineum]URZ06623.1 Apulose-4-phosphate transketolase subunit A [Clostridium felsineum]URZ11656.1 Apulose-4-phosphate transketolase subunit A [Clostridium felsineum]
MNLGVKDLEVKATEVRRGVLDMVYRSKAGHIGGSMSSIDILTTLYYNILNIDSKKFSDLGRDRFILSKGHIAEALYYILADRGFFDKEKLKTYSKYGSTLIGHPNNKNNGVEVNTGSLGHGLPIAVGMALAGKRDNKDYRVYTLMGDGEQAEGSIWEGAMAAHNYKLDNLIGIIDRNRLQISGTTEEVMALGSLKDKWTSFGWEVVEVDGNNIEELVKIFSKIPIKKDKPTMIIANTVKGKGISFMENKAKWHHGVLTEEEYKKATKELEGGHLNE